MNRVGPAATDSAISAVTRIDQIVYAWSRRTRADAEGYFPIASSLSSTVTRSWNGLLAAQVKAGDSPADHPPTALAYVVGAPDRPVRDDQFDVPDAALVHRVQVAGRNGAGRNGAGRNGAGRGRLRAHVLIGRADYLTERVALALYAAGGATAGGARTMPRLPPLHLDDLTAQRRTGERTLRQAARVPARRNQLTALVSTVLTWSWTERPFMVSHTGPDEAVTLMWALVEMLEGVLPYRLTFAIHAASPAPGLPSPGARAATAPNQPASVSASASNRETLAVEHGPAASDGATTGPGPSAPRFLFVPVSPELVVGADPAAVHVDPRVVPPVPPAVSEAARLLVDVYGRSGIRGVSGLLALVDGEAFQPHDPGQWCRRLVARSARDAAVDRPDEQPSPDLAVPRLAGSQLAGSQPIGPYPISEPPPSPETAAGQPSPTQAMALPADARSSTATPPAAGHARAVVEHLHDAYELLLAPGPADEDGTDPAGRLIAILTRPVGLPIHLPSAERLRGQLRRIAGQLTGPLAGASGRQLRSPAGWGKRTEPTSREQGRAMVVAGVLDRLGEVDPADRARVAADVEAAVVEEQRQVEGALTALADDLAALRGPSPTRGAEESLRQAIPPLAAGLESILSSYRLPSASGSALRLATETLDALRTVRPGSPPATTDQPDTANQFHPDEPETGFEVTVTAVLSAAASPLPASPVAASPVATATEWPELERAAQVAVTRYVAAAYRMEWSYWDGRLHPVDRLLAAFGVPLGVSLTHSGHDPLADPLKSPTELRELASLRDLFRPPGPPGARFQPKPHRPPGQRADVLARAASDVTQAITRLAPADDPAEFDRAAYVTAVHTAVATMHRQIVQLLAGLVADLGALAVTPVANPDRRNDGHRAARVRDLLRPALRTVFDRFGLTEGYMFADALANELAWLTADATLPATAPAAGAPAESPAAAVVRLLRETRSWGADAFRVLVLYAPGWYGAEDLRDAIADAAAFAVPAGSAPPPGRDDDGPGLLAAGARPFLEALAAARQGGSQVVDTVARVLDLYTRGVDSDDQSACAAVGPRRPASSPAELHDLGTELTVRIPPSSADGRSPAVAFLDACGPGPLDPARVFGLLVRHVPSWDDAWDLHEAIWSRGAPRRAGTASTSESTSESGLQVAAEEYFRRDGGPHPADLERVVHRLVALYLPDDPRLRAEHELSGFVESRVIAEIAERGAIRRRRRSFGLPVFAFTLAAAVLALFALVR
ncbi:hypothetical protein [Frankia gtarii]|uniref:hypothetical protein n=1 Tax=Frankia gtarii TaxID=2950102 RepID=UPI0021C12368|nr:hypothetical protein [Frankia gtarii]